MVFPLFSLLLLLSANGNIFDNAVEKEFNQIQSYELVHFDIRLTPPINIIEFDAFNQHYIVQLIRDEHLTPSNVRHTNGNLATKYGLRQFYTHLNESCHYSGKVLNSNDASIASVSMCRGSGITGRIHAFGDVLIIKPSKYFLDREYDRWNLHDIHDEHLVYKLSHYQPLSNTHSSTRRRLASDDVTVQIYALAEASFVDKFKDGYPNMWYDKLVQYLFDIMSGTAAIYNTNNWGSGIGTFKFMLAEVNVVESNIGDYRALANARSKSNEGYWLLEPIYDAFAKLDEDNVIDIDWSGEDGTQGRIDQATIFTYLDESDPTGIAAVGAFCRKWNRATSIMSDCYQLARTQTVYAHELGHNFGVQHDSSDNSCPDKPMESVMSGSAGGTFWSSCSKDYVRAEFADHNDLECLRNEGDGELQSNINQNLNEQTPQMDDPERCLLVSNMGLLMNGEWKAAGTYNTQSAYYKDGLFIYYAVRGRWFLFNKLGEDPDDNDLVWWQGSCKQTDIRDCDGNWDEEDYPDSQFALTDCSGSEVDTPKPTADASQCIIIAGFNSNLNGEYHAESVFNSRPAYTKDNLWFFTAVDSGGGLYWAIYTELTDGRTSDNDPVWGNGWCGQTNLENCAGKWDNNNDATFAKVTCGDTTTTTTATPTTTATTPTTATPTTATPTTATPTTTTPTTTAPTSDGDGDSSDCIKVSSSGSYSGDWIELATFNSNPAYKKDGIWILRAKDAWGGFYWAIHTELTDGASSDDDPVWTNGWCGRTALEDCTGNWDNNDDANGATFTKSTCNSDAHSEEEETDALSCVRISNLKKGWNGEWDNIGDQVYQFGEQYLSYQHVDGGWYWTISNSPTSADLSSYCTQPDIVDCSGQWYKTDRNGNTYKDQNCIFRACSGALEALVPECVANNEYESHLCMYYNHSALGTSSYEMDFEVYHECSNDKAMYTFTRDNATYFIWYDRQERSGETYEQWIMSEDSATTNAIAYCHESDLFNCLNGKWTMKQTNGDTSEWIQVEQMSIFNRACVVTVTESKGIDTTVIVMIVLAVVVVGGIGAVICLCYVLSKRKTKVLKVVHDSEEEIDENQQENVIDDAGTLHTQI